MIIVLAPPKVEASRSRFAFLLFLRLFLIRLKQSEGDGGSSLSRTLLVQLNFPSGHVPNTRFLITMIFSWPFKSPARARQQN